MGAGALDFTSQPDTRTRAPTPDMPPPIVDEGASKAPDS